MAFNVLTIRTEEHDDSALYPCVGAEADSVELEPTDGAQVLHFIAGQLEVHTQVGSKLAKEIGVSDVKASVFVTDARIAVACSKYDKGGGWVGTSLMVPVLNAASHMRASRRRKGKMLVGHLRYPWIAKVGFSEKSSWLTSNCVRILVEERMNGVDRPVYFDLTFPKGTDVAGIAHAIAQRTARFRLGAGLAKDEDESARLEQISTTPRLAPVPGKFAFNSFPRYHYVTAKTAMLGREPASSDGSVTS